MPSKRPMLSVRLTDEGWARFRRLQAAMERALSIEMSQSDVIHAALAELEKRYPPPPDSDRKDSKNRTRE